MNILVVYESMFGNTEKIARAIADKLSEFGRVKILPAAEAQLPDLEAADLLVMGGPTQRHGVSPLLKNLLESLPRGSLKGRSAAAFDTRYHINSLLSGSAAQGIASKLKKAGVTIVTPPKSFYITEQKGPLAPGELERAGQWAGEISTQMALVKM